MSGGFYTGKWPLRSHPVVRHILLGSGLQRNLNKNLGFWYFLARKEGAAGRKDEESDCKGDKRQSVEVVLFISKVWSWVPEKEMPLNSPNPCHLTQSQWEMQ